MKRSIIAAMSLALPLTATAANLGEAGFSGELSILAGFSSTESNFNTDVEHKSGPLNSEADSKNKGFLAPIGQLRYTFGSHNQHQVFAGTSREDIAVGDFVAEVGYKLGLQQKSSLSLSFLPSLMGEAWENPYITGKRETTDVSSSAFRVKYSNILDSNFSADFALSNVEIDDELSPDESLDRDGNGVYTKLTYSKPLMTTSVIEPSIIYKSFDADGSAMSKSSYGAEIAYKRLQGRHQFAFATKYMLTEYDAGNIVFNNTKQKDDEFSTFLAYGYTDVAGWKNWNFNALVGYDLTSSNIDFYNENQLTFGVGTTFKF